MKKDLRSIKLIESMIEVEYRNIKKNGIALKTSNMELVLFPKGKDQNWKLRILEHSRKNFYENGTFNKLRNCYYPSGNTNKDIAEHNKLEKLFKKWGFKTL